MVVLGFPDEIDQLVEKLKPYSDKMGRLKPDAPESAVDGKEALCILMDTYVYKSDIAYEKVRADLLLAGKLSILWED